MGFLEFSSFFFLILVFSKVLFDFILVNIKENKGTSSVQSRTPHRLWN